MIDNTIQVCKLLKRITIKSKHLKIECKKEVFLFFLADVRSAANAPQLVFWQWWAIWDFISRLTLLAAHVYQLCAGRDSKQRSYACGGVAQTLKFVK
ncbi:MAG: hypothetical protein IT258_08155 [Saprospiraceae bacterium]|nr:hypothetical protein [Saprospiraceae bacterium]